VDTQLDVVHFSILPEVYLSSKHNVVFRFGLAFGWLVQGSETGTYWSYNVGMYKEEYRRDQRVTEFGLDLRVILGLGFNIPIGEHHSITLDPYISDGVIRFLRFSTGAHDTDFGIKLGFALRSNWRNLSRLADDQK
jgi:hypothetical protein